ncbi:Tetratricopeptide TPR_1 repeat-containing protein [Pseudopedobacter saltans DSM 12145]|uniref:Tetratricopeptide TPR_1 repeat-containing protein n=1 Tax=Pseudopedobacter saltans (strain ATCC 51119 / DSM 12145 / JCM 21818 / CCUG 39354 / LMG 10337 / NBRC 100064 / NCIMB 13643) TaxID=762903 RepID=F0S826_PSESL|nr:tetratricopeptide repeat protein [Pseudopedobacter saltans]ADY51247.1 Tetratricopeptide TPR_1 repeat-containing protein [Pseudopedobacter saltans DSM 12145]
MTRKFFLLALTLLFFSFHSRANFDFNNNCKQAYQAIFDLRLQDAKSLIQQEKTQNPNNGITILLENYVDYFSLLASENKNDYERLKALKSNRISTLEKQDKSSPYYLFSQAEIYLQWGLLQSRFQDYFSSAMDIRKADKLLSNNADKFPAFLPNKKSSGLIDVIFGSIPANLRGITSTFGFKGNINNGIKTLENLATTLPKTAYSFYKDEVAFFLCYIEVELVHNKSNYNKIMTYAESLGDSSLLRSYLQGYISLKNAQNDKAIMYLQNRPKGNNYIPFPALDYLLGNVKLNRMDSNANVYLANFLNHTKGVNYIKDAYLKLAYFYYLRGDNNRYQSFIKNVSSKGNLYDEKDKQALREANDAPPDLILLKARLFFDGGYYNKALALLANKDKDDFKLLRDKIEFYYRLGRLYDETNRDSDAITNYQQAINVGHQTSYYYAANAALSIGNIYEKRNDRAKAASFYKQAIAMKNHEYETSIENKAKDGLKRIGY